MLPDFEHVRATSVPDALKLLSDDAMAYHGGTELLAVMRMGLIQPARLVDLKAVDELSGVSLADDTIIVGAGTTHRNVGRSEIVQQHAPLLADVVERVGNIRVRATGTVGGNICFAEPKSDLTTALIALDAAVTLVSTDGTRTLPLDEFLVGAYVTELAPAELLTEIRVPVDALTTAVYHKFQIAERPTVGVAAAQRAAGGYRVVVGAVADRPVAMDADSLDDFDVAGFADSIDVIADLNGDEDYKRHVTAVTIRRAIDELRGQGTA